MKLTFRKFEIEAIELLAKDVLSAEIINKVVSHAGASEYEYTGGGYYLSISEDWIPDVKLTVINPVVIGTYQNIMNGFIVHIGNHRFTLECHDWSEVPTPVNFRDFNVDIEAIELKPEK